MSVIVKPFVTKYMNVSDIKCKGCKAKTGTGSLVIGTVADLGHEKNNKCQTSWFHYKCFWTLCMYKNQLRGIDTDTLNEMVYGISGLTKTDKFNFQNESSSMPTQNRRKSGHVTDQKSKVLMKDIGSVESGDYELNDNTFDLTDLVCVSVYKFLTNIFISIRQFFKIMGSNVAKPSKYGISLTKEQWRELVSKQIGIEAATKLIAATALGSSKSTASKKNDKNTEESDEPEQILFSLAWKCRVSVHTQDDEVAVDIRKYSEDKTFKRSTRGISLTVLQWRKLVEEMPNVETLISRMDT